MPRPDPLEGLSDERRAVVEEMAQTLRDLHSSSQTVFGIAPTRVIDGVGMLALQAMVRAQHAEQAIEGLRKDVDDLLAAAHTHADH